MELSARNQLKARVETVTLGTIMAEVIVTLPDGQQLVSVITRRSAEHLDLKRGDAVVAVVKSTEVILGKF